jgi:hypothetical protein
LFATIGPINRNTMARFIHLCFAGLLGQLAYAQTPDGQPPVPSDPLAQECLIAADASVWTAIGLNDEQMERVKAIQGTCRTDCMATKENGAQDAPVSKAIVEKHEQEVKQVLTPDQWAKWQAWCRERPARM